MHPVRSRAIGSDTAEKSPVRPGDVVGDKYRIERMLGEGGMGLVFEAEHLQLHQSVALKFMLPSAAENQDHVARFRREARAAVRLRSQHVARVLDVGNLDSGPPYIVMELLEGQDLAAVLDERGTLPLEEALDLLLQAAIGLAEAHAAGIVHRDIKPENLFVTRRPDGAPLLKILDFGISKAALESDATLIKTKTGSLLGSPHYMSPEQMRLARDVDERTDVWALGAILYTMLAGRSPFFSKSLAELCANVLHEPPAPLDAHTRGLPAEARTAIGRCLEKDRNQRFRSVEEVAEALAPIAGAAGGRALAQVQRILCAAGYEPPEQVPDHSPADAPRLTTPTLRATRAPTASSRPPRARTWVVAVAALGAVAAVAIGAAVLRSSTADPQPADTAATPGQAEQPSLGAPEIWPQPAADVQAHDQPAPTIPEASAAASPDPPDSHTAPDGAEPAARAEPDSRAGAKPRASTRRSATRPPTDSPRAEDGPSPDATPPPEADEESSAAPDWVHPADRRH